MIKLSSSTPVVSEDCLRLAKESLTAFTRRTDIGFPRLATTHHLCESSLKVAKSLRARCHTLVVVGIGGSSLGVRTLQEALAPGLDRKLVVLDNVDPVEFARQIQDLDAEKTAFALISKSGGTIETLVTTEFLLQKFGAHQFRANCVVISELRSNPLSDWAREHDIPLLEIPQDVGGRFSVLSPVGLFPLAFLGGDPQRLLAGAAAVLKEDALLAQVTAGILASWQREERVSFIWSYCAGLQYFGAWLQQLWSESLGKALDRKGKPAPSASVPVPAVGPRDQHSILQQVMEGTSPCWVMFHQVASLARADQVRLLEPNFSALSYFRGKTMGELLQAEADATAMALQQQGVSCMTLQLTQLTEFEVGGLLMFWQMVVAGLGEALDINAFDQPGVELGKRLALQRLR